MVRYKAENIPPTSAEDIQALTELPDDEIDTSEIPEWDELDFKYTIPSDIFLALNKQERLELGRTLNAAKEAERTALIAWQKAETAIAKARQLAHQT